MNRLDFMNSPFLRSVANYFGFDKLKRLQQDIRNHGGLIPALGKLRRFDEIKSGRLVGVDKYGNKYYENPVYFFGRSRWVEYAEYKNCDMDGSQVAPEWSGWLSYRTDAAPYCNKVIIQNKHKWLLDHSENLTGTVDAYMPYDTTRPKLEAWDPKKVKSNRSE